jgi:hypothetical protein
VELATLTTKQIDATIVGAVALWLALSVAVALYGNARGYPFFPLFICAAFLGPFGWVIVLLVVTIAAGPRVQR